MSVACRIFYTSITKHEEMLIFLQILPRIITYKGLTEAETLTKMPLLFCIL